MKTILILISLCFHKSTEEIPQCLGRICERRNSTGQKSYIACEPRNNAIIISELLSIDVQPENSTCGMPQERLPSLRNRYSYTTCNASRDDMSYKPTAMIDNVKWTWWISRSWKGFEKNAFQVNITLSLPKVFLLTEDILIDFREGFPEKMIVEKSSDHGKTWATMQYFSNNCWRDFGVPRTHAHQTFRSVDGAFRPLCSEEFSMNYDWKTNEHAIVHVLKRIRGLKAIGVNKEKICELINTNTKMRSFLEITNLRIRLLRPPLLQGPKSKLGGELRRLNHYRIQEIRIVARCQCNGHASQCPQSGKTAKCVCNHNTRGSECQLCQPIFWMQPWKPGSYFSTEKVDSGNPCLSFYSQRYSNYWLETSSLNFTLLKSLYPDPSICECNNHSNRCETLYTIGTVCVDCRHNTEGQNCHRCKQGYYQIPNTPMSDKNICQECTCNEVGSFTTPCDNKGQCKCKENFVGRTCNKCVDGYQLKEGSCKKTNRCELENSCDRFCREDLLRKCKERKNKFPDNPPLSTCEPMTSRKCSCRSHFPLKCESLNEFSEEKSPYGSRRMGDGGGTIQKANYFFLLICLALYCILLSLFNFSSINFS